MRERNRAPERSRPISPMSEAWHDLSRFVADTKALAARRAGRDGGNGDPGG